MTDTSKDELPDTFQATISTTSTGVGFVSPPEQDESKDLDDFVIPQEHINGAFDGDIVLVQPRPDINNERGDLTIAEVIEVIRRAKSEFVGTIQKNNDTYFLIPDKKDMYEDIFIHTDEDLPDRHKAVVEITDWGRPNAGKNPSGTVKEVLGPKGDHEVEMQSILREKDIEVDFPQPVMEEAAELGDWSIEDEDLSDRKDIRDVTTFTIDPASAKDYDDAISFRRAEDGNYKIGVHIADVSHFVRPDTAIDQEARKRAFSVYLVDRTIPMLPPVLSNDLCSLNPEVDRLAFSVEFTINQDAELVDRWFGKSVIHSDHRFSYREAQDQIDTGDGELSEELTVLNDLAQTIRDRRFGNGSIDFHGEEVEFELDDDGTPVSVTKKERLDTHKMIEEYMLLANREIAKEIKRMTEKEEEKHFFMYRVHGLPDRERLGELGIFLQALGYDFNLDEDSKITHADINALLEQAENEPEEALVNTEVIRTMDKASYATTNEGHFGLAFEHYTHFTSPIRRYPDLLVHRLLYKHLRDIDIPTQEYNFYQAVAEHASEREREVMDAERDSVSYKRAEYMQQHIGEEFTAVISGISKHGFYVEEKKTLANGMVSVNSLDDDYYEYDEEQYALVGKETGKKYTLGDKVKVKLVDVDIDNREIDFELVGGEQ